MLICHAYYMVISGWVYSNLAIEQENRVVVNGQAFNTGDDQIILTGPIGSDSIRASIMDPLDMDAFLPIPQFYLVQNFI